MSRNTVNPGLFAKDSKQLFPLKYTEVGAKISGNVARVEVTQTFENPFITPLEAVYVFPLPDESAVDEMEIKVGDKIIKGSIKKRQEAQEIYDKAKKEGRTAGLLEQERDNIFTQSLANILPGEQIDVTIRYTDSLKFDAGSYEFVFPMVVGPRYISGELIPSTTDTDLVPDASRITPPVIPPGMRTGYDINVTVEIHAGVVVTEIKSPSHQLEIEYVGEVTRVKLSVEDTIPNKDFILRYQVAQRETQSTVLTQVDERGGHFAVYLIPALEYQPSQIVPKDVVFLVDTSGSQSGAPLQQCQELMRRFINGLNPDDTFAILDFSDKVRQLSKAPLNNTPENRTLAIDHINKLKACGATEMLTGITAAINFPAPIGRLRTIVLLSDGYIGNENDILAEVQSNLKAGNRLYSFGAGSSVNRFLLNRIAEIGRGVSYIIRHDEKTDEVTEKFFRQVSNPVLMNIEITCNGEGEAGVIYPAQVPDLFAEQPLVLFGRKKDGNSVNLSISGITANCETYKKVFDINFDANGNPAIAQLWGRACIKALINEMFAYETTVKTQTVSDIALTYKLLSKYTAFVAVSEDVRVNPDSGKLVTVEVPVEMPEGVEYDGIFGGFAEAESAESTRGAGIFYLASPAPASYEQPEFLRRKRSISTNLPAQPATPINPQLEVINITGLEPSIAATLTNYLQSKELPTGFNGKVVVELQLSKGRVQQVSFDEDASTLNSAKILAAIRRLLVSWQSPNLTATVHIIIQINS